MMAASAHPRPKILIVEDEPIVAADICRDLDRMGYEVVGIANRGAEAIRIAEHNRPELVLMDILLPGGMDGIAAATELRRRWDIPVVFVTANTSDALLDRVKDAEPLGYLGKPFRTEDLNATVSVALRQNRRSRKLFDEHTWLSTILGGIGDGVVATDRKGFVRYLNAAAEKLTGWNRDDAEGLPIENVYRVLNLEQQPSDPHPLRRILSEELQPGRSKLFLQQRSGPTLMIEEATAIIGDQNGGAGGAVTVFQDITFRQLAEQERERLMLELERSNEELSRFAYSVSHDLKEPMRTVKNLSEILLRRTGNTSDEEQRHLLGMITTASDQMQRLITSLLGYAHVGEGETKRERVDTNGVLASVQTSLASAIQETGATISYSTLPSVSADRVQLEGVFQNLLANAIHYRRPNSIPVIRVECESVPGGWQFQIRDNGQGIPPDFLEKIFQPLQRLHGRETAGTGIGLALCRRVISRHGGRIWAESEGPGRGATFRFFLPDAL